MDGFRYDYVPGMYDGPMGQGYADLVYRTYQHSQTLPKFQIAERTQPPSSNAPNTCQTRLAFSPRRTPTAPGKMACSIARAAWLAAATSLSGSRISSTRSFLAIRASTPAGGDVFPVAPFQYFESHDHERFINQFGTLRLRDLLGERYGNRDRFLQSSAVCDRALHGQRHPDALARPGVRRELGRAWLADWAAISSSGRCTGNSSTTPQARRSCGCTASWARLRRTHRALRSRGFFYYYYDQAHLAERGSRISTQSRCRRCADQQKT